MYLFLQYQYIKRHKPKLMIVTTRAIPNAIRGVIMFDAVSSSLCIVHPRTSSSQQFETLKHLPEASHWMPWYVLQPER